MKTLLSLVFSLSLMAMPSAHAAVTLAGGSLDGWHSLGAHYDFFDDQQTGQTADDIQGDADNSGFFTGFMPGTTSGPTDGKLAFRARMGEVGNQNAQSFGGLLFVGIDANLDGSIDAYLSGSDKNNEGITIRDPGTGLNISPNTTTIGNEAYEEATAATNFNYRAVDTAIDGGTTNDVGLNGLTDYYVSFALPFVEIANFLATQGITDVTVDTPFRYVLGTATQSNSFNQDIGGIDGNDGTIDLNSSWEDLGGFTPTSTTSGGPVPEPSSFLMVLASLSTLLRRRRRA